jgi:molybdenum cofactor biosynthesis enzyme MoaA
MDARAADLTCPKVDFANILLAGPCNQRCPYCIGRQIDPALNQDNLDLFPPRNLAAFVALLRARRVRQVVLTGTNTDPQLYRHEARLIGLLRDLLPGVQLSLHTNGQLAMRKMDILNCYDRATISFPSFDPDTFSRMTGSRQMPDLAAIVRDARIPVKVSCLVNADNAGQIEAFLARCRVIGVRRVVLRRPYGELEKGKAGDLLRSIAECACRGPYRGNPVYVYGGEVEVTWWDFVQSTSRSLNLFGDGTISADYLLARARHAAR